MPGPARHVGAHRVRRCRRHAGPLVLCVHGTTHLWERLGRIADLGALVSMLEVDWPTVLERARQIGAEGMVLASLEVADLVTGCGIRGSVAVRDRIRGLAEEIVDGGCHRLRH